MIWYVVLIANNIVVHESFYGANFSELHSSTHNMVDLRLQKILGYQVVSILFDAGLLGNKNSSSGTRLGFV